MINTVAGEYPQQNREPVFFTRDRLLTGVTATFTTRKNLRAGIGPEPGESAGGAKAGNPKCRVANVPAVVYKTTAFQSVLKGYGP
jgi:hypothetical protein